MVIIVIEGRIAVAASTKTSDLLIAANSTRFSRLRLTSGQEVPRKDCSNIVSWSSGVSLPAIDTVNGK